MTYQKCCNSDLLHITSWEDVNKKANSFNLFHCGKCGTLYRHKMDGETPAAWSANANVVQAVSFKEWQTLLSGVDGGRDERMRLASLLNEVQAKTSSRSSFTLVRSIWDKAHLVDDRMTKEIDINAILALSVPDGDTPDRVAEEYVKRLSESFSVPERTPREKTIPVTLPSGMQVEMISLAKYFREYTGRSRATLPLSHNHNGWAQFLLHNKSVLGQLTDEDKEFLNEQQYERYPELWGAQEKAE